MPTIKTYFGDYLLGLFVEWTSKTNSSGGSSDVTIKMTQHLRSKLHVYGFAHLTETVTYDNSGTYTLGLDDHAAWTANNNSFIGYIGTGTANTDLDAQPTAVHPAD